MTHYRKLQVARDEQLRHQFHNRSQQIPLLLEPQQHEQT